MDPTFFDPINLRYPRVVWIPIFLVPIHPRPHVRRPFDSVLTMLKRFALGAARFPMRAVEVLPISR